MNVKVAAIAAALAVVSVVPSLASAAPFQNGSFETGTFTDNTGHNAYEMDPGSTVMTGWTTVNDDVQWTNATNGYVNISSSDGSYFLDLTGTRDDPAADGDFGGVTQAFTTVKGATYNVSFDLGSSAYYDPSTVAGIHVDIDSGVQAGFRDFTYTGPVLTGTQSGYQTETFSFTAAATTTQLTFTGSQGQEYIGLDNISVSQASAVSAAPEPGAWVLMLGGVGLLGACLRIAARGRGEHPRHLLIGRRRERAGLAPRGDQPDLLRSEPAQEIPLRAPGLTSSVVWRGGRVERRSRP